MIFNSTFVTVIVCLVLYDFLLKPFLKTLFKMWLEDDDEPEGVKETFQDKLDKKMNANK